MSTTFCQKCKQEHPGRVCDYDDKGDCAELKEEDYESPNRDEKKNGGVMEGR